MTRTQTNLFIQSRCWIAELKTITSFWILILKLDTMVICMIIEQNLFRERRLNSNNLTINKITLLHQRLKNFNTTTKMFKSLESPVVYKRNLICSF